MARHYTFRQNSTSGQIVLELGSGLASTIATASAAFAAVNADGDAIFTDGLATISDVTTALDGSKGATLTHSLTSETTETPGIYWGEFVITYTGGAVQIVPEDDSLTFRITSDPRAASTAAEVETPQGILQSQVANGFSVSDLIYLSAGSWELAQADDAATMAQAMVLSVESTSLFRMAYLTQREVTMPAHGMGAAGTKLYTSQTTAGEIVTVRPTTGYIQQIGQVKDANTLQLQAFGVEVA